MATFAIMGGNTVINCIVADTIEDARIAGDAIEYTSESPAGIGWTYDQETGKFNPPVEEEPNA